MTVNKVSIFKWILGQFINIDTGIIILAYNHIIPTMEKIILDVWNWLYFYWAVIGAVCSFTRRPAAAPGLIVFTRHYSSVRINSYQCTWDTINQQRQDASNFHSQDESQHLFDSFRNKVAKISAGTNWHLAIGIFIDRTT